MNDRTFSLFSHHYIFKAFPLAFTVNEGRITHLVLVGEGVTVTRDRAEESTVRLADGREAGTRTLRGLPAAPDAV